MAMIMAGEEEMEMDGERVRGSLSQGGLLRWRGAKNLNGGSVNVAEDVVGYISHPHTSTLSLTTFTFPPSDCTRGRPRRMRKQISLTFTSPGACELWSQALDTCLSHRPKRLLIFLNPFGGRRRATKVFKQQVEPLLSIAGVRYTVKETQFHRHAKDLAKSMDLSQYDGIVCVSGDGVLVEVLNGLLERADWAQAIRMPLGAIPAGTGNGVVKSVLDARKEPCDASNATFAIIRGFKQALDVATVVQGQARFHSILSLSWGLVADVDIESERFRWMGILRAEIYTLIRIFRLRHYEGSLAYVPAPGYEGPGEPLGEEVDMSITIGSPVKSDGERSWRKIGYMGPVLVPERSEWRSIQGTFILVWLQNVPWAAEDIKPAPLAMLADGYLDLTIIKDCPRWELLRLFTKLNDGSLVNSKYVIYLKVKAFHLSPGGRVGSKVPGGIIDLDGEVLARGHGAYGDSRSDIMRYGPPIKMTIEKGLATIFCPS